jgi:AcrR family transcriptional regulator
VADSNGTRQRILDAARESVVAHGLADLSTRMIAESAQVPVSQLHYHFGGKQGVLVGLLERETERLLARQAEMFSADAPLWKRWEQACDFLEDDLRSGYVLVLQQMMAAGWTDPEIAVLVRERLQGWYALLADVVRTAASELGGLGPFTAEEVAALVGDAFLGAEATILLGLSEDVIPSRSALRRIGSMIRAAEEAVREDAR